MTRTARERAEARQLEPEDYVDAIMELCRTIDDAADAATGIAKELGHIKDILNDLEKHTRRNVR